jgi:hypothetical protein
LHIHLSHSFSHFTQCSLLPFVVWQARILMVRHANDYKVVYLAKGFCR